MATREGTYYLYLSFDTKNSPVGCYMLSRPSNQGRPLNFNLYTMSASRYLSQRKNPTI